MAKQFAYFYLMRQEPDKIQSVVPLHVVYWKKSNLSGYMGGPFADKSGGLITFKAESVAEATHIITADPFVTEDLLEERWIKEWLVE